MPFLGCRLEEMSFFSRGWWKGGPLGGKGREIPDHSSPPDSQTQGEKETREKDENRNTFSVSHTLGTTP